MTAGRGVTLDNTTVVDRRRHGREAAQISDDGIDFVIAKPGKCRPTVPDGGAKIVVAGHRQNVRQVERHADPLVAALAVTGRSHTVLQLRAIAGGGHQSGGNQALPSHCLIQQTIRRSTRSRVANNPVWVFPSAAWSASFALPVARSWDLAGEREAMSSPCPD